MMRERSWNTWMTSWNWRKPSSPWLPKRLPFDVQETQILCPFPSNPSCWYLKAFSLLYEVKGKSPSLTIYNKGWACLPCDHPCLPIITPVSPCSHLPSYLHTCLQHVHTYLPMFTPAFSTFIPAFLTILVGRTVFHVFYFFPPENQYYFLNKKKTPKRWSLWKSALAFLLFQFLVFFYPHALIQERSWRTKAKLLHTPWCSTRGLTCTLGTHWKRSWVTEMELCPTLLHLLSPIMVGRFHLRALLSYQSQIWKWKKAEESSFNLSINIYWAPTTCLALSWHWRYYTK